jgi:hypothetical protein
LENKKIRITGGTGFTEDYLVDNLPKRNNLTFITDNFLFKKEEIGKRMEAFRNNVNNLKNKNISNEVNSEN